jgi:hypothetical protein
MIETLNAWQRGMAIHGRIPAEQGIFWGFSILVIQCCFGFRVSDFEFLCPARLDFALLSGAS